MLDAPPVLVAHEFPTTREGLAAILAERRPGLDVRAVAPEDLAAALAAGPAPVVVASRSPSAVLEGRARGWVVLPPDGPNVGFVGVDGVWRTIEHPEVADIVAAVDELLARSAPGGGRPALFVALPGLRLASGPADARSLPWGLPPGLVPWAAALLAALAWLL